MQSSLELIPIFEPAEIFEKDAKFRDKQSRVQNLAKRFTELFTNPEIKAVFFALGGEGAKDIPPLLDYDKIKSNKKIIMGFSDHTYILGAVTGKTGLVSFYGSDMVFGYGKNINDGVKEDFKKKLMSNEVTSESFTNEEIVNPGKARGILLGGNMLRVKELLLNLGIKIDRGTILFIESLSEDENEILDFFGWLGEFDTNKKIKGLVIGHLNKIDETNNTKEFILKIKQLKLFKRIPIIKFSKVGHCKDFRILPIGIRVIFDTSKLKITFEGQYLE